jgi:hypothetical protein
MDDDNPLSPDAPDEIGEFDEESAADEQSRWYGFESLSFRPPSSLY